MGEAELADLSARSAQAHAAVYDQLAGLVRSLRPQQWYKQLVVFLAVVFSLNGTEAAAWASTTAGAFVFCAIAGSVYLVNDVCDRQEDRAHPTKRHRPIASGQVSPTLALGAAAALVATGLAVGWWLEPLFFAILLLYLAQNVAYNTVLRDIVFADLLVVGVGFVLRALAGVVLVGSAVSPWLVLCTFLAALFLGLSKRKIEAIRVEDDATRETLSAYPPGFVDMLTACVGSTLLLAYSLYTFSVQGAAMMVTIPFAFYAVFRYAHLVWTEDVKAPGSMFTDRGMLANFGVWGLVTVAVLYVPRLTSVV